jgi:hypothetical protein
MSYYLRYRHDKMALHMQKLQDLLNYRGCTNVQFVGSQALGKIGTTGFILGTVAGFHLALLSMLMLFSLSGMTSTFAGSLMQWSTYMTLLCAFHFLEFFMTAVAQPSLLSYDCK